MAEATEEIRSAILSAAAADFPEHTITRVRICATEPTRIVARVFKVRNGKLPIRPTPYVIYAVDLPSMRVQQLTGPASKPYRIPNYK